MNLFGWCSGIGNAELLMELGFDFIELPLAPLQLENKEAHVKLMQPVLASPLPVRAFNVMFPGDLKIVGPLVDESRVRDYIALTSETLTRTNASIVVLGSAGARNVPDGWERARAEQQFLKVLSWCADELRGTAAVLAIEPLNRKESNLVNSIAEAVAMAEKINRPEIRVLADFFHMDEEKEPLEELKRHMNWLAHIHLADTGRKHPGSGQYDYDTFAALLKEIEYTGLISAECAVEDAKKDMGDSLQFLRRKWNRETKG